MELNKTQQEFIMSWGNLGSKWGLNKTLAQIHALFIITDTILSAEDIMDSLKISRGNVNMNVRTLIDWGLVYKESKLGERKEFFIGEKDMWLIFKRVLKVRKDKELDPMLEMLKNLKDKNEDADEQTTKRIESIQKFASEADNLLDNFLKMDESWFWSKFIKLIK